MPVALISTRTSPAFGPSRSTSTISSGFLASNATAARVFISGLRFRLAALHQRSCSPPGRSLPPHTGIFRLGVGCGLVFLFGGTCTPDSVVGAGTQIDVEVVHITGDIRIIAKRRHHLLLRRVHVLAATRDDTDEVAVAHGLERLRECGGVSRSHPVRPMADVAFR